MYTRITWRFCSKSTSGPQSQRFWFYRLWRGPGPAFLTHFWVTLVLLVWETHWSILGRNHLHVLFHPHLRPKEWQEANSARVFLEFSPQRSFPTSQIDQSSSPVSRTCLTHTLRGESCPFSTNPELSRNKVVSDASITPNQSQLWIAVTQ